MSILDLVLGGASAPAECIIKVGASQTEIVDQYPLLTEVVVVMSRAQAATATLKFETRREDQGRWAVQDAGVFAPWEPLTIEASFGNYREEIIRGFIRQVNADYPRQPGATTVTVECQDESLALDREHIRREWGATAPIADGDAVREIATRHGLAVDVSNGPGLHGSSLHQDSTDIKFLRARAEANGYELIIAEGSLYFGPMRLDATPQPTILVYAGRDTHCVSLAIRDDGHKPDAVVFDVMKPSGADGKQVSVEADIPLLGPERATSANAGLGAFTWRLRGQPGADEAEQRARAVGYANELAMKVAAEGELDSSAYGHVLRIAEKVGVDGVGERYSGLYYVDSVTHQFNTSGYRQHFKLLRNAYGDNL